MSQKKSIILLLLLINWVDLAVLNKKTDIEGLLKAIQLELEDKTEPIDEIETESNAFDFCQSLVRCEKGGRHFKNIYFVLEFLLALF